MKFSRRHLSNLFWIVLIVMLFFTPAGFHAKVFLNRALSFTTSVEKRPYGNIKKYDWQLYDLKGRAFNFEQYKNKVVVVNFWATWCPPCVAEMPSLVELHREYGEKVQFIFLAKDKKERVRSYLKEKQYAIPVFFSDDLPPNEFQGKSLPTTYIVDAKGTIMVKEIGAVDWSCKQVIDLLDALISE